MIRRALRTVAELWHLEFQKKVALNPTMLLPPGRLPLSPRSPSGNDDEAGRGPDFVGIGVPKAGTSWWYQLIIEHPDVVANRAALKELNFFSHYAANQVCGSKASCYRELFAAPPNKMCGEWSPGYFHFPLAIDMLAGAAPNTRVILLVRDPIERMISHLSQMKRVRARYLTSDTTRSRMFRTFSAFPEAMGASLYAARAQRLLSRFAQNQILCLQYEKCATDPRVEIAKTYAYLGLDTDFTPPSLARVINGKSSERSEVGGEYRALLISEFADDVVSFSNMFPDIDLALWPNFCSLA